MGFISHNAQNASQTRSLQLVTPFIQSGKILIFGRYQVVFIDLAEV